jgi:membrane protease YdiL (CAAX protease family)
VSSVDTEEGSVLRWAWVFYLLLAIAGVLWLGLRQGSIGLALFVAARGWPLDLVLGLGVGGGLVGCWEIGRRVLPQTERVEAFIAETLGRLETSEALALAVLSGIAEEFFFRGAVQAAWGWLVAAGLFTLLHLGPGREFRIWTAFAALAGLAFGGLMLWRGNLLAPTVAHILVNAVGLWRVGARSRREATG